LAALPGHVAEYDSSVGEHGIARIDEASLALTADADLGPLFGAIVAFGDLQETGHMFDELAWRAMGVSNGDTRGDEGARFALLMTRSLIQSNRGEFNYSLGGLGSINVDRTALAAVALNQITSGSIHVENRVDGLEYYGPAGHYHTTFLVAHDIAKEAGRSDRDAYFLSSQLALGSQLPDMIASIDAKQAWLWGNWPGINRDQIHSRLHSLAQGANGVEFVRTNRANAGALVTTAISDGRYALAGLAIHYLGDSYAHTYATRGGERAYRVGIGHGLQGTAPDNMYNRPTLMRRYVADLAGRIADGLGVSSGNRSAVISRGTARWETVFSGNSNQADFSTDARRAERDWYVDIGGHRSRLNGPYSERNIHSTSWRTVPGPNVRDALRVMLERTVP
jgi:hypothetical protein